MASRLEFFHSSWIYLGHNIHEATYTIKKEEQKVYLVSHWEDMIFVSSPWLQRGLLELLGAPVAGAAAGADLKVPGPPVGHLLNALRGSQAGTQSCRNTGHHPGANLRREA